MMKRQLISLLVVLTLGVLYVSAQPRSEADAVQMAQSFFNQITPPKQQARLSVVPAQGVAQQIGKRAARRQSPAQSTSYYIVNDEANQRFVIVSADERLYDILGYTEGTVFDAEKVPAAMLELLDGYNSQYDYVLQQGLTAVDHAPRRAYRQVAPLIQSSWGQGAPYNNDCPNDGYGTSVTGCVATAMAQVMRYYQYPAQGQGSNAYTSTTRSIYQSMDFSTCYFDWANMPLEYKWSNYTTQEKTALALLNHACGVAVNMDYTSDESGAYSADIAYALKYYFKYNPYMKCLERDYYTAADWDDLIHAELEANRPMFYSGSGSAGGHQFIIDGCNDTGYHINWGWYGSDNSYFKLTALNPGSYNFSTGQDMVLYVSPQTVGQPGAFAATQSFSLGSTTVSVGSGISTSISTLKINSVDSNSHGANFTGSVGIGLFDTDFQFVKELSVMYSQLQLATNQYYNNSFTGYVSFDAATFTAGKTYIIAPYIKENFTGVYSRVHTSKGETDYYTATVADGKVTLTVRDTPPPTPHTPATAEGSGTKADPYNSVAVLEQYASLATGDTSSEWIYVKGKVAYIQTAFSTTYGNADFYVSPDGSNTDGETFFIYRSLYLGNKKYLLGDKSLALGDEVVVCGNVKNYNGTLELVNGYLVSLNGTEVTPEKGDWQENPYTVEEALAQCTSSTGVENKYVTGYITEITKVDTGYGNATFYIADTKGGTPTLYCYRLYGPGNKTITNETIMAVNDKVVLKGKLSLFNNMTKEISTGYIVSVTKDEANSVEALTAQPAADRPACYDLQGRRVVAPAQKGVYIVGGKKAVVR